MYKCESANFREHKLQRFASTKTTIWQNINKKLNIKILELQNFSIKMKQEEDITKGPKFYIITCHEFT